MAEANVGDVNLIIELQVVNPDTIVAIDISTASTKEIYLARPDGTVLTKTATFTTDGTDGKIQFATASGDFTVSGPYTVQAHVVWGGNDRKTSKRMFEVEEPLA